MINTSKNTILTWAIVFLLIVNIGVIGLFLIQRYRIHKEMDHCSPRGNEMTQNKCMSDFMKDEMKFTEVQMKQFHDLKSNFHPTAKLYFDSLDQLETRFFEEITKPVTDSVKLYSYAAEFSRLQHGLKHKTIQHLLTIKSICNPDQQKMYFEHIMKNRHCRDGLVMRPPGKHGCPDKK